MSGEGGDRWVRGGLEAEGTGKHTPERYRDRCSWTVLYVRDWDVLKDLDVERRHD